jgi:hypothetical protein
MRRGGVHPKNDLDAVTAQDRVRPRQDRGRSAAGGLQEARQGYRQRPVGRSPPPLKPSNLLLQQHAYFVHRLRMVTGKDGNPLNEVELIYLNP